MSRVSLLTPPAGNALGLEMITMLEPLGLICVAGALEQEGHDCQVLDLRIEGSRSWLSKARRFDPRVVGIQCNFTSDRVRVAVLARKLREHFPDSLLVMGGHDASRDPGWFLDSACDAVVIGDGEEVMPALVREHEIGGSLSAVPGLALMESGRVIRTPPAPARTSADDLPYPARHLIRGYAKHYYSSYLKPTALLETSRGCPFRCSFCSVWKFHEGRFREKSAERIVRELQHITAPNVFITDDIFWINGKRDEELAQAIVDSGVRKHFIMQTRTDVIARAPELVEKWTKCGKLSVFLGLEKVDDAGLKSVNKRNTAANNDRAIEILQKLGVGYTPNFIVDPQWHREDFRKLRDWVSATGAYNAGFSILTPLPGTDLWDEVGDRVDTRNWELFDLEHTVLPTALPLEEFYEEYAGLWGHGLDVRHQVRGSWPGLLRLACQIATGRVKVGHLRKAVEVGRALSQPKSFLRAHEGKYRLAR